MSVVEAFCFGDNDCKQLGLAADAESMAEPETVLSPSPLPSLSAGTHITSVAFGASHSAWLAADGVVYTVGDNTNGQCGVPSPSALIRPQRLESLATSFVGVQVSCGSSFTAVVTECGALATFGANDHGQLGHGPDAAVDLRRPKLVKSAGEVSAVACGDAHCLILDLGAAVASCGQGRYGALGLGHSESASTPTLVRALSAAPICMVAAGERHSVALTFGGAVLAWGWGKSGALGLAAPTSIDAVGGDPVALLPRPIPALRTGIVQIAAGGSHTVALADDGGLFGWGVGLSGAAPAGTKTPVQLMLPAEAASARATCVATGRAHSLALLEDGSTLAWGQAQSGQIGSGTTVDAASPRMLSLPRAADEPAVVAHAVVAGGHSSAVLVHSRGATTGEAKRVRQPARLDLATISKLAASADWSALAAAVSAVFGSPALCNASFADEWVAQGGLRGADLESVYVALLRTFERAPAVLSALKESVPRLIESLGQAIHDEATLPPLLQRSASSSHSLSAASSTRRRSRHLLTPLAAALHNPLLSHSSEGPRLRALAVLIDEKLSAGQRQHLSEILATQPAEIFAARVVRPVREALERAAKAQLVGGDASMGDVVSLLRLLGLARDAQLLARQRRSSGDTTSSEASANAAAKEIDISDAEFYSTFISEHVDLQRDYLTWMQAGPSERGSDWRRGWSFCSEAWVLNPQAKARLLQVEAAIQMQQTASDQVARLRFSLQRMRDDDDNDDEALLARRKSRRHAASAVRGTDAAATRPSTEPPAPPPPDPASPYLLLRVRRSHLVEDSLDALARQDRRSLLRPLRVAFEGEPAIDEGGVRKEFFQCLVEQLFNPDYGMFEWADETRVFWFSRTSADSAEFFLIGLVVGLAIYNGIILDLHFPRLLWRRLMNEAVGFESLPQISPDLCRGLRALLDYDGDVEATFMAEFTVASDAFGAMEVVELVPGGQGTPVTNENRQAYVEAYTRHLLVDSVHAQFSAFQRGFLLLCDGAAFSLLTPAELEELVVGTPRLDFRALEANTTYAGGFHAEDPTARHFWEVVHAMGLEDKRALLLFATGCDRAPVGGLGKLPFVLQRAGPDAMDLPTAHTCFNMLALPAYTSRAKLRDRLTIAIHNSTGFGLQ